MIRIKELPLNVRPVERLINIGPSALSNDELIAIILKTGTKELSSKDLALKLLNEKELPELVNITYEELTKIKGIGSKKASVLLACIEFSKRINKIYDNPKGLKMNHPRIIYNYYRDILKYEKRENFYAIYLDNNGIIIKDKLLFLGTINYSMVSPREIFKEAYLCDATSIVLMHNHPSNNIMPSNNDYLTTKHLKEIGDILGIKVVDHIIIGKTKYYSLKENDEI